MGYLEMNPSCYELSSRVPPVADLKAIHYLLQRCTLYSSNFKCYKNSLRLSQYINKLKHVTQTWNNGLF